MDLYDVPSPRLDLERVLQSLTQTSEFGNLEVLKTGVLREHGTYVVRVVIDREGGVGTDLCEAVSRFIAERIESSVRPAPDYRIEVASAGLQRPLLRPDHYRRFTGRAAKVVTSLRIKNRVDFSGTIVSAGPDAVTIADPYAGLTPIPYAAIKRANLLYDPSEDLHKNRPKM